MAACALVTACAGTASPQRSALQQKIGSSGGVSATELRLRLYELPQRLGGIVETAADRIRSESRQPAVRRQALIWKADGIPAIYTAALRPDPLAGALDLWVLLYQMESYFESGPGRDAFGARQEVAVAAMKQTVSLAEETATSLYTDRDAFDRRRTEVREFARAHPIEGTFSSRESVLTELAKFSKTGSSGTLAAVGQATETLADISLRLNAYVTLLPKIVRWEAELASEDVTGRDSLGGTLDDIHNIGDAARRAGGFLDDVPGTVRQASVPLGELLDRQRAEMLSAIDRQRLALTAYVTSEREAALAAVAEERRAAMASIAEERAAVLAGLDGLAKRSLEDASGRARGITDHVFWRALVVVAVAALLFGVAFRFAQDRRIPRISNKEG
jgi:hypothetical protein